MKVSNFFIIFLITVIGFSVAGIKPLKKIDLISPLVNEQKVLGVSQWFPKEVDGLQTNAPEISATAAIFIDAKDGKILYSKNQEDRKSVV